MSKVLLKPLNIATVLMAAFGMTACATTPPGSGGDDDVTNPMRAQAQLRSIAGEPRGEALVESTSNGIKLTVNGIALPQGPHGVHIHMTGRCDAPDFSSAGGHWNPTERQHGMQNPQGPHAGDLPNLLIGTDGRGSFTVDLPGAKMAGTGGLLDADGAAFVVHAGPDDMVSDPAGNSGGRIACGVFAAQ